MPSGWVGYISLSFSSPRRRRTRDENETIIPLYQTWIGSLVSLEFGVGCVNMEKSEADEVVDVISLVSPTSSVLAPGFLLSSSCGEFARNLHFEEFSFFDYPVVLVCHLLVQFLLLPDLMSSLR